LNGCTQLTDQSIMAVADNCCLMEELGLSGVGHLTDAAIEALEKLTELKFLSISQCNKITDKSTLHLARLSSLRSLRLSQCSRLSTNALEMLRTILTHRGVIVRMERKNK